MNAMKIPKLTGAFLHANSFVMQKRETGTGCRILAASLGLFALGGCVTVEAPTEPIVIELNVNIRQEVIYRLAQDAGNTIEENADIF